MLTAPSSVRALHVIDHAAAIMLQPDQGRLRPDGGVATPAPGVGGASTGRPEMTSIPRTLRSSNDLPSQPWTSRMLRSAQSHTV